MTARPLDGIRAVAIGASAGGVEALSRVLPALAPDFGGAVFVVLHLPRERPSLLPGLFAPKCRLHVAEAVDKQPVEPGTIYFAPPDYHLLIEEGPALALSDDEPVHFSRPSIDVLFESAAAVYGPGLMGVILTGASQDGSAGLDAVHAAGGVTFVQEPSTAQVPLMTAAALQRGPADYVLDLDGLVALLNTLPGGGSSATAPRR